MTKLANEVNNALIQEAAIRMQKQGSLADRNIHEVPTIPDDDVLKKVSTELADDILLELHAKEFASFKDNIYNIIDGFSEQIDDRELRDHIRETKPTDRDITDMFRELIRG